MKIDFDAGLGQSDETKTKSIDKEIKRGDHEIYLIYGVNTITKTEKYSWDKCKRINSWYLIHGVLGILASKELDIAEGLRQAHETILWYTE
jgi:hypothetical protein